MRKSFKNLLSSFERVRDLPALRWLGPRLHDPRLWHVSREGIARGVAIGIFFGLLVPLAQFPLSAIAAILLRANLPIAVASTLVTNPFTFAPIYYLAYRLGALLLGIPDTAAAPDTFDIDGVELTGWMEVWSQRLLTVGKPLFTGLLVLGVAGASTAYMAIHLVWRTVSLRAWRRRQRLRKKAAGA